MVCKTNNARDRYFVLFIGLAVALLGWFFMATEKNRAQAANGSSEPSRQNSLLKSGGGIQSLVPIRFWIRVHVRSSYDGLIYDTIDLYISSGCQHKNIAVQYAQFLADPECQRTLYFQSGGQPGHRSAWLDEALNHETHNFFRNTLETLDQSYMRPRYDGYLYFQENAGLLVLLC